MKALIIDHDDSFTYNLQDWLAPICEEIQILNHRDLQANSHANFIVLSPGPKNPQDYPHVLNYIQHLPTRTALYGVCLGLQMMVHGSGGKVSTYSPPLHGKKSSLEIHDPQYMDLNHSAVARYHSLYCSEFDSEDFTTVATSSDDKIAMWLKHRQKRWMGVQFHPESFLTENAELHLKHLKDWLQS